MEKNKRFLFCYDPSKGSGFLPDKRVSARCRAKKVGKRYFPLENRPRPYSRIEFSLPENAYIAFSIGEVVETSESFTVFGVTVEEFRNRTRRLSIPTQKVVNYLKTQWFDREEVSDWAEGRTDTFPERT